MKLKKYIPIVIMLCLVAGAAALMLAGDGVTVEMLTNYAPKNTALAVVVALLAYAVKSLLVLFTSLRKPQEQISFYEFKLLKEEKRGTVPRFILYVGLLFLGLSVLFLWIYYGGGR